MISIRRMFRRNWTIDSEDSPMVFVQQNPGFNEILPATWKGFVVWSGEKESEWVDGWGSWYCIGAAGIRQLFVCLRIFYNRF
jgi:hypothetical protein